MNDVSTKRCGLHAANGSHVACTRETCAFWEPGGAVLDGDCLVKRLHVDLRQPGLADYLLDVRGRVERRRRDEQLQRRNHP
jgi:hypothetical protein